MGNRMRSTIFLGIEWFRRLFIMVWLTERWCKYSRQGTWIYERKMTDIKGAHFIDEGDAFEDVWRVAALFS